MAARLTCRTGLGMLTAIVLAAMTNLWGAAADAQGDSGWSTWQNLDRSFPYPEVTDVPVRLSATVYYDRRPIIVTVARNGWMTYREARLGVWSEWQSLGGPTWLSESVSLLTELRAVNRHGNLLELFGLDQQGRLWTIYQQ